MDKLQVNSQEHTQQFKDWSPLLTGQKDYSEKGEHLKTMFYNPEDANAVYMITRYMRDSELNYINIERKKYGKSILPRLAYVGEGIYIPVINQAARKQKENEVFQDYNTENIFEKLSGLLAKSFIKGNRL